MVLTKIFCHGRCHCFDAVSNLSFDDRKFDAWFRARNLMDWAHLAQQIQLYHHHERLQGTLSRNRDQLRGRQTRSPPSVYTRQVEYNSEAGLPVRHRDGKIQYFETMWTLPVEAVRNHEVVVYPECVRGVSVGEDGSLDLRRLVCLVELVKTDYRVFECFEQRDRRLLYKYWTCTGQMPRSVQKDRAIKKMIQRDKDQSTKEHLHVNASDMEMNMQDNKERAQYWDSKVHDILTLKRLKLGIMRIRTGRAIADMASLQRFDPIKEKSPDGHRELRPMSDEPADRTDLYPLLSSMRNWLGEHGLKEAHRRKQKKRPRIWKASNLKAVPEQHEDEASDDDDDDDDDSSPMDYPSSDTIDESSMRYIDPVPASAEEPGRWAAHSCHCNLVHSQPASLSSVEACYMPTSELQSANDASCEITSMRIDRA